MSTQTYNFDDMTDIDWIKALNKPVMIGVYLKSDDSVIVQFAGNLLALIIKPDEVKWTIAGDRAGWFDPKVAYALISFEGE